ncbi:alpha/beta hydrolase [Oribacterium sp. WCC10]|uniref:alpha/beta hydrolase n=1 Tax=Oribacterium sp. WCC10 TaxID=1855343 RepID=UPI0015877BA1|nr:alpha/beta hydrolase fold domain-containing protein [Oribacterium sp. WCC10]
MALLFNLAIYQGPLITLYGVNASYEVIKTILEESERYNIDSKKVIFGGFSAGACMAIDMMILCNRRREFSYLGVIAFYPGLDFRTKGLDTGDISLSTTSDVYGYSYFSEGGDLNDSIACPVHASIEDLKNTPSIFLMPGELDPLRFGCEQMAMNLMKSNVPVIYHQFTNCAHGFTHRAYVEEPKQAIKEAEEYIKFLLNK